MIQLSDTNDLILVPRAFAADTSKGMVIPLERCYVCPTCGTVIEGAFSTENGPDNLLNLNPFASGNEHTMVRPEYSNQFVRLPGGSAWQIFRDENHCGAGKLQERVNKAAAN